MSEAIVRMKKGKEEHLVHLIDVQGHLDNGWKMVDPETNVATGPFAYADTASVDVIKSVAGLTDKDMPTKSMDSELAEGINQAKPRDTTSSSTTTKK